MEPLKKLKQEELAALTISSNPELCFATYRALVTKRLQIFYSTPAKPTNAELTGLMDQVTQLMLESAVKAVSAVPYDEVAAFVNARVASAKAVIKALETDFGFSSLGQDAPDITGSPLGGSFNGQHANPRQKLERLQQLPKGETDTPVKFTRDGAKIAPYSQEWRNEVYNLMLQICENFYPCQNCNYPYRKGYLCANCRHDNH